MGVRTALAKATANLGRGISGVGYRLGTGALITEMQVPPGLTYQSYLNVYGQVGWLFGAVNLISESVADASWHLYRTDKGKREEVEDHPLTELMQRVNRFQTWYQFSQLMQMYILLVGEAFIVLNSVRVTGTVIPVEMWLAPPQYMVIRPDAKKYISHYEYRRGTNILELPVEEVIHIFNPNPANPYRGIGTAQSIGVDLDSERYATRYQNRLFYNDATPGLLIEFPSLPPKPQRDQLREEWDDIHRGWRNARKTGFLWGGAKANTLTMTNRDMDFWRLRKINRETILGAFRIPTSLMGLAEVGSRARAEADEYIFSKRVIKPALTRIREGLNEQLCNLYDKNLELDYEDPVPENLELIATQTREDYKVGMITREEAREQRGYDREPPKGDTFVMPMNLIPSPSKATPLMIEGAKTKTITEDQKEAHWRLYAARTASQERMVVNMLASLWDDQLRQIIMGIDLGKRDDFLDEEQENEKFKESFEPIIYEIFVSSYEETLKEVEGREFSEVMMKQAGIVDQRALEWIATRSLFMSKSINKTTIGQVRQELAEGFAAGESNPELTRRIRGYFKKGLEHRAPMTARTETIAASNEGALQGYEAENIERVEFYAAMDERTCEECMGFHEKVFATKDSHGIIPVHPNCRCTWIPVIGDREPKISPPELETLRYDERTVKAEHDMVDWTGAHGRETSRAFSKDGSLLFKKHGEKNRIHYNGEEMRIMHGSQLQVHTHPGIGSFSADDFHFAALADVKEAHAVTSKYRYIMTPEGAKWDSRLLLDSTTDAGNKAWKGLRGKFFELTQQGMSRQDAVAYLSHEFNIVYARKYNIKYTREDF